MNICLCLGSEENMATINDFKYVKLQSKNMCKYIPELDISKLEDIKKERLGFYHLILEKITSLQDAKDVQLLIQDQEYLKEIGGIVEKDLGIDAVYINKENSSEKEIMLFNFKYRKDFNPDKTTTENDIATSMKFFQYLKSNSNLPSGINKKSLVYKNIKEIRKCLKSDDIYKITLFLVTNEAKGFSSDADELVSLFCENYDMDIKSVSLDDIVSFIDIKKEKSSASMIFPSNDFVDYKVDEKSTSTSYICKLSLLDLIRITCNNKVMRETFNWENVDEEQFKNVAVLHSVLYDNVRGYLGSTNYNKNIANTIKKSPESFFMFNNGVTITSENISCKKGNLADKHIIQLDDFQIVNGGQTLRSAYNYFSDTTQEDRIKKLKLSKVLVRIFKIENELDPMKNYISEYTNSQNAISSIDLKSVSQVQIEIERYLKAQNILYIRKAGDIGDETQDYLYRISMEKFTQLLYSSQGFPERVSNTKKKLFIDYYDDIYNDDFKIEDFKQLIIDYFELNKMLKDNSLSSYDQKIFYLIYLKYNHDVENELLHDVLMDSLGEYDPDIKESRALLRKDFKEHLKEHMSKKMFGNKKIR